VRALDGNKVADMLVAGWPPALSGFLPWFRCVDRVCTENPIRVDNVTESPKLAE